MNWNLDTAHSHVEFAVRHLGISTVKGRFRTFDGVATTDSSGNLVKFSATIDASSIDTGAAQRDAHLRSPDFFDVESHPEMRFESSRIEPLGSDKFRAHGELTMRGKPHPVALDVELEPPVKDPYGNTKLGATAVGRIRRSDWGLTWNQALETGGLLVSDDVKIVLEVQGAASA
jgi:polyisoprenoid-binding protein YceI